MEVEEESEALQIDESSNDSSSDEEEKALLEESEELERQLQSNEYLYEVHEKLVNIYRKLGDLKSMRAAYERFHENFPLTPKIWLAWINDEKMLANTESEIKYVLNLFEKAVNDYLSIEIWLEFIQYHLDKCGTDSSNLIVEKALASGGRHAESGSLLWDNLREIALANLSQVDPESESYEEHVKAVANVFRRQLSVPLLGMENTYAEFQEFIKNVPDNIQIDQQPIELVYQKALKMLDVYKLFENKLINTKSESELYEIYKDYIKNVSDPSTVLCLYDRATSQLCLNTNLWLDYCLYAFKLGEHALKVSEKAIRNCPWSEDLWIIRLRIFENVIEDGKEVLKCFEKGLSSIAPSYGLNLWLAYLEYNYRAFKNKQIDSNKIFKLFDQAIEQLGFQGDPAFKVTKWYAKILAKEGHMQLARKLWKKIVYNPQSKGMANVWLEYSNLERQFGDEGQLRGLYQKALSNCTDWPQCIAEEWILFERESGELEDILKCEEKCKEILIEQAAVSQECETGNIKPDLTRGKDRKRKMFDSESSGNDFKKFKIEEKIGKKIPIVKDPKKTVFISNLYPSITEKRLKKVFPNSINIELVMDKHGKSRCYGYIQFEMEEEVMHALSRDREPLDGRPIYISNCKPDKTERHASFKYSTEPEPNKLFIKNLPIDKNQEEIEAIFKPYNPKSVRLVYQKSGQSKGLAYIEFEDEESTKKALKNTDQMKIGEHTISVALSAPPSKSKQSFSKPPPTRHARSRLQVPLIPRSLQKGRSEGNGDVTTPKSNEDFRKMLLNK